MSKKVYVALTSIAFEAEDKDNALERATQLGKMLGTLIEQPIRVMEMDDLLWEGQFPWDFKVYVSRPSEALPGRGQDKEQAIL